MRLKTFKSWQPASIPKPEKETFVARRGSARKRLYDAAWDRLSTAFRAKNPLCHECLRLGLTSLTDVTDHLIPIADRPDLRLDWDNLQALCTRHNATKVEMEIYARKRQEVALLPFWTRNPEKRPGKFGTRFRAERVIDKHSGPE